MLIKKSKQVAILNWMINGEVDCVPPFVCLFGGTVTAPLLNLSQKLSIRTGPRWVAGKLTLRNNWIVVGRCTKSKSKQSIYILSSELSASMSAFVSRFVNLICPWKLLWMKKSMKSRGLGKVKNNSGFFHYDGGDLIDGCLNCFLRQTYFLNFWGGSGSFHHDWPPQASALLYGRKTTVCWPVSNRIHFMRCRSFSSDKNCFH